MAAVASPGRDRMLNQPERMTGNIDTDVCVIGSGPAGLAVATELVRRASGVRVCIVESGGAVRSRFADSLRVVESEGIQIREDSRERILGGTSTTWSGISTLLDEIDFAPRPWVPGSGWPIRRSDLLPFYDLAATRFGFPSPNMLEPPGTLDGPTPSRNTEWVELVEKRFMALADPQKFGTLCAPLLKAGAIETILDTTVVELITEPGSTVVSRAVAARPDGTRLEISAKIFVVACGGIENSRLLLLSRSGQNENGGLGNEHDQVGRYLMNHPKGYAGTIDVVRFPDWLASYLGYADDLYRGYVGVRVRDQAQASEQILNSYLRFEPLRDGPGIASKVLRRLLGTGGRRGGKPRRLRVRNFMEMAPDPDNRVTLGTSRDSLGQPVAHVRHESGELDRRSIVSLHRALRRDLERTRWGTLDSDVAVDAHPWPIGEEASHHMGTTRMGSDPRTSVVDPQCRLHGSANVYLAGSSVFCTSGSANPTLTIVALALRLACSLAERLAGSDGRVSAEIG